MMRGGVFIAACWIIVEFNFNFASFNHQVKGQIHKVNFSQFPNLRQRLIIRKLAKPGSFSSFRLSVALKPFYIKDP